MRTPAFLVLFVALIAAVGWAYAATLAGAAARWADDPQYSHGYLVPVFSLYLLYRRRALIRGVELRPSWLALAPLAVAVSLRLVEARYFYNGLDQLSVAPAVLAAALAAGGRPAGRWVWPAALFLIFMVPLPFRIQTAMSGELQAVATRASAFLLVTAGLPAVTEGNVIVLGDVRVGVVEACSGLGMGVTFLALAAAYALVSPAARAVRLAVMLSALPIAVLANVARIAATGLLFHLDRSEAARAVYHDLAGWLMIPLGCGMILFEAWFLGRIVAPVAPERGGPPVLEFPTPGPPAPRPA